MAALVIFRDALIGEFVRKDVIGDAVQKGRGESGLQVVRIDAANIQGGASFVRQDELHLSKEDERELVSDFATSDMGRVLNESRAGSLAPGEDSWKILLRGKRNQGLRILNIEVVNVVRESTFTGTLFDLPPQGIEPDEFMSTDLDQVEPIMQATTKNGTEFMASGPYFAMKSIHLKNNDEVVLVVRATTKKNTVSFKLKADYQVGDSREYTVIDNGGKPFKLTAYNCTGEYKSVYKSIPIQSSGGVGIVPVQPRGYKPQISGCSN